MTAGALPLDSIVIGDRVRKDMGDIAGLAESIKRHGLLHPIVVKADKTLVAGHRRIEAVRLLGQREISVTEIDVADLLSAERDENEERKQFTPSEAVAIGRLIEEQERPKAVERRRESGRRRAAGATRDAAGRLGPGDVDSSSPGVWSGAVREIAARAVGMSGEKYTQAKAVVAAAEAEPARFGDLVAEMDETGNVRGTYREVERRKALNLDGPTPPPPEPEPARPESKRKAGDDLRHPVHRHSRHRDQTKEMERGVWAIEAAVKVLVTIDPASLDETRTTEWISALADARSKIGAVLRGLRDVKK